MKIVVMGCGRVGSSVACRLDGEGHDVTVLDPDPRAFQRFIPSTFSGTKYYKRATLLLDRHRRPDLAYRDWYFLSKFGDEYTAGRARDAILTSASCGRETASG